jgi:outer membrane biosynthesis protein TonB
VARNRVAASHCGRVRARLELRRFYIDQEGKPRLPAILSMDDPILAEIALETIREWRFAPPTSGGEPAITRARQQFVFHGQGDS